MRMHKQDSPLIFLDHLHTNTMPVADTITTFFIRCCVYFAFFGKTLSFQTGDGDADCDEASPPDNTRSDILMLLLFVSEDSNVPVMRT